MGRQRARLRNRTQVAALAGVGAEITAWRFPAHRVDGLLSPGRKPAEFDQQPIEAHCTVSACLEAYRSTSDARWHEEARLAFEWFLGRNDLGLSLYNPATGGCCDGLHMDRVNLNQGAESTLAYLMALSEMELLEHDLKSFQKPSQHELSDHRGFASEAHPTQAPKETTP